MSDELKKYFEDINYSISTIGQFTEETRQFQQYQTNTMLKSAVQWHISVIAKR